MVKLYYKIIMAVHKIEINKLYLRNIHFNKSKKKFIKQQLKSILHLRAHIDLLINHHSKSKVNIHMRIQIDQGEPIEINIE